MNCYHFYNMFIYPHTIINPITIKFLSRRFEWLGKCCWVIYHYYSTKIKIIMVECEEVAMISITKQLQHITFHFTFWYLGPLYALTRSAAKSITKHACSGDAYKKHSKQVHNFKLFIFLSQHIKI